MQYAEEKRFKVYFNLYGKDKTTIIISSNKLTTIDNIEAYMKRAYKNAEIKSIRELVCIDKEGEIWK